MGVGIGVGGGPLYGSGVATTAPGGITPVAEGGGGAIE